MNKRLKLKRVNSKRELTHEIEYNIGKLAAIATRNAFNKALQSGNSVLIAENNFLYEILPNGTKNFIEELKSKNNRLKIKEIKLF